jgi:DNA-binding transcriptional MerR regulator
MSTHRIYTYADLRRLTFIRRCRNFGFPIKQIRELVALVGAPERDCTVARDVAEARLIEVGQRLKELRALERILRRFVEDSAPSVRAGRRGDVLFLKILRSRSRHTANSQQHRCLSLECRPCALGSCPSTIRP